MGKLTCARVLLLAAFPLVISGCSSLYQQAVAALRQPGEQAAGTPDDVWRDYNCAKRDRPFVRTESLEVVPERIKPGGRVNYRLIYVMCPLRPSEVIKTRVSRKMLFRGRQVAVNVNDGFEIKPGRWVVDSFFTLPPNSPPGVYALEVSFDAPAGRAHRKVHSFVVAGETHASGPGE